MWLPSILVGLFFSGSGASFAAAPIRWGVDLGRNLVVAPELVSSKAFLLNKALLPSTALPTKLALRDASGSAPLVDIPQFTANTDNTIRWESAGLCLEASGAKSGDAVGVNQCNGGPSQLWNFVLSGHGQNNQIRLKDTEKCMDVNVQKGDLNGAPIELRECSEKLTETWRFEGPLAVPSFARYASRHPVHQVIESPLLLFLALAMSIAIVIAMAGKGVFDAPSLMIWGAISGITASLMGSLGWRIGATAADMSQDSLFLRVDPELFREQDLRSISGTTAAGTAVAIESPGRTGDVKMIGLFGNSEESKKKRADLSLRSAPPGSRVVRFRKPNKATTGILLGMKFREGFGGSVFIDKILPNTEAARLKERGQLTEGDQVVMCSATFGDEMWSSRGVGKYRLEKSIVVRQGMFLDMVLENTSASDKKRAETLAKEQEKQKSLQSRLQKQLQDEVTSTQKKGPFGLW